MPTVFYKRHGILITDDVYAAWGLEPRMYDLEGLQDLHVEHDGRPARVVLLVAGALATVGAVVAINLTEISGQYVVTAGVLLSVPLTNRALRIFSPGAWHLCARYAGAGVTLFTSTNFMSVMRVRRGLMRAFTASAADVERLDRSGYAEAYGRLNSLL
ncbi:DUF6232 family protein [Dactylosporangium sp. CA-139066]|uniref:DUF6232 family protein n=1 Tax=Dactylosporangium sp. CA-139066 TaxID=3239930 RepID=UPI003D9045DE